VKREKKKVVDKGKGGIGVSSLPKDKMEFARNMTDHLLFKFSKFSKFQFTKLNHFLMSIFTW
jgi:hypothetical protein